MITGNVKLITQPLCHTVETIPGIPCYSGREKRRELFRKWGVPNVAPRRGESSFSRCRVLFVDDDNDGQPVAYWVPDKEDK